MAAFRFFAPGFVLFMALGACAPGAVVINAPVAVAGSPMANAPMPAAPGDLAGGLRGTVRVPLVAAGAGNLVAAGGGDIVAAGGGNIVAAGGGNLIGADAGSLVAAGGGNLVAAGAGNYVGPNGAAYRLAAADDLAELPVEGATVLLRDARTLKVVPFVAPARTDATGAFAFTGVPAGITYLVEVVGVGKDARAFRLAAYARAEADAASAPIAVDVATTVAASRLMAKAEASDGQVYLLDAAALGRVAAAVGKGLRADAAELRKAAEALAIKPADATQVRLPEDYAPKDFAPLADAAVRLEARDAAVRQEAGALEAALTKPLTAEATKLADRAGEVVAAATFVPKATPTPAPAASGETRMAASPTPTPAATKDGGLVTGVLDKLGSPSPSADPSIAPIDTRAAAGAPSPSPTAAAGTGTEPIGVIATTVAPVVSTAPTILDPVLSKPAATPTPSPTPVVVATAVVVATPAPTPTPIVVISLPPILKVATPAPTPTPTASTQPIIRIGL